MHLLRLFPRPSSARSRYESAFTMRRDVSYCLLVTIGYLCVSSRFKSTYSIVGRSRLTIRSLNLESCVQIRPGSSQPLPMSSLFLLLLLLLLLFPPSIVGERAGTRVHHGPWHTYMHVHVCTTSNSQLIRTWFRVIIEIVRSQAQFGVCDRVILRCEFMMDSECIN